MGHDKEIIVIGAGPGGVAAGVALGERAVVLDRRAEAGGLSGTIQFEGTALDWGGHSFHTPHPAVRELVFNALDMYEQRRDARCFVAGQMIPYPFQANFRALGDEQLTQECAAGLAEVNSDGPAAADFQEHLERRFGAGISRHFLLPYNRKLWGPDLRRLSADWAGERVAAPEGKRERFTTDDAKRKPLQQDTQVAYPARGGFGEIMSALARRLHDLRLNQTVVHIDPAQRLLRLESGVTLGWQRLVSTMPLDKLVGLVKGFPAELAADVGRLEKLSLALVLIAIDHPIDTPIQRIYCADDASPAHKIALNHNSSPQLRGLPRHGIVAEVSYSASKPLRATDDELTQRVVAGLQAMGVIRTPSEVHATKVLKAPYGYPVPSHERFDIVTRVKKWLEDKGIHTLGRFGEWAYINSDEAIHRGLLLGKTLAQPLDACG